MTRAAGGAGVVHMDDKPDCVLRDPLQRLSLARSAQSFVLCTQPRVKLNEERLAPVGRTQQRRESPSCSLSLGSLGTGAL